MKFEMPSALVFECSVDCGEVSALWAGLDEFGFLLPLADRGRSAKATGEIIKAMGDGFGVVLSVDLKREDRPVRMQEVLSLLFVFLKQLEVTGSTLLVKDMRLVCGWIEKIRADSAESYQTDIFVYDSSASQSPVLFRVNDAIMNEYLGEFWFYDTKFYSLAGDYESVATALGPLNGDVSAVADIVKSLNFVAMIDPGGDKITAFIVGTDLVEKVAGSGDGGADFCCNMAKALSSALQ